MHHADALVHGIEGRLDIHLFTVQQHFALKAAGIVDHRHTEQRVHQGGLAGTVLTEKGVDFARSD